MLTNGVVLNHDNTQTFIPAATVEMIKKLKFKLFPHPTYSLDLTPSDFWTAQRCVTRMTICK
jgi:hypothetical protein